MPYLTAAEVKERTSFSDITALPDAKITGYIERAEGWLHRETKRKFRDETDEDILVDVRTAVVLLVEYLWYWDNPDVKEEAYDRVDSEKIGLTSYSYRKPVPGEPTGLPELDNIIEDLKVKPVSGLFFRVNGPSKEAKRIEQEEIKE